MERLDLKPLCAGRPKSSGLRSSRSTLTETETKRVISFLPHDCRRLPDGGVAGRFEIAFAEFRDGIFAAVIRPQMARRVGSGEMLTADFLLQRHQAVEQRLGTWRATRN